MRLLLIILFTAYQSSAIGAPDADVSKAECAETKAKIRKLESRMRQGYTAKKGVRMEDELRRLRERRKRVCR
ncbi:MAG: hypothetical protein OEY72_10155 [Gammaproteobacteria bacterium]|nr:hypothetical protein [Gammaproteobacteria bacterium]